MRLSLAFIAIAIPATTFAAHTSPKLTTSFIERLPQRFHFFPNTSNILIQGSFGGPLNLITHNGLIASVISDLDFEKMSKFVKNPFDPRMMIVQDSIQTTYRTTDGGTHWSQIDIPFRSSNTKRRTKVSESFHFHSDAKRVIVTGLFCEVSNADEHCSGRSLYTLDISDETPIWTPLPTELTNCIFACSSSTFPPSPTLSKDHIFCYRTRLRTEPDGKFGGSKLVQSSTYFAEDEELWSDVLPPFVNSSWNPRIEHLGQYLVATTIKSVFEPSSRSVALFSNDASSWNQAKIPIAQRDGGMMQHSQPILFSHAIGIYHSGDAASLYRSDHDSLAFTKVLDCGRYHDCRPEMAGTGGSLSWDEYRTLISADDGTTWKPIGATAACKGRDNCSLHIHTKGTRLHGRGYVLRTDFARPSLAPGYTIGVGCTSNALCDYESSATYFSRDGGASWEMIYSTPTMHASGNNGDIIVLSSNSDFVDHILYSLDGGLNWSTFQLNLGFSIKPKVLLSSPVSQAGRFVLIGSLRSVDQHVPGRDEHVVISLDFSAAFDRNCSDADYEIWRVKDASGDECMMGHKSEHRRRKVGTPCASGNLPTEAVIVEHCACTEADYECDFDYTFNNGTCVPTEALVTSTGVCADSNESYTGTSGYRKIPGNTCQGGIESAKEKPVTRMCRDLMTGEAQPDRSNMSITPDQVVLPQWPAYQLV